MDYLALHRLINFAKSGGHTGVDGIEIFRIGVTSVGLHLLKGFFHQGFDGRLIAFVLESVAFSNFDALQGRLDISHGCSLGYVTVKRAGS